MITPIIYEEYNFADFDEITQESVPDVAMSTEVPSIYTIAPAIMQLLHRRWYQTPQNQCYRMYFKVSFTRGGI
jgi:hypothetical protein